MKAAIAVALLVLLGAVSAMKVYDDLRWDCVGAKMSPPVNHYVETKMCVARW